MMNKYRVSCTYCGLKITMLLATRPKKCPVCKECIGLNVVEEDGSENYGVSASDCFASGGNIYIHAEADCNVKTKDDAVMEKGHIATVLKGASVEFEGLQVSPTKVFILDTIVRDVIGVETTLSRSEDEIKNFFQVVHNRIHNGLVEGLNSRSLADIRILCGSDGYGLEIINTEGKITEDGVRLLQFMANRFSP
jgi:hypothetical protein